MLQYEVADVATLPEETRGFYKEENGRYVLQVSGAVSESRFTEVKTKLDEFRTNNTTLLKEQQKFKALTSLIGEDGLDPDKLQGRIQMLADARIQEMRAEYEAKLKDTSDKYTATAQQLSTHLLSDAVVKVALKHGVVESAVPDVIGRAQQSFEVVEGKVVAKNDVRNKKGEPMSVEDWFQSLTVSAPHFFGQTTGTGASKPSSGVIQPALTAHDKLVAGLAKLRR